MGRVLVRGFVLFGAGFLIAFAIAFLFFHVGRPDADTSEERLAENVAMAGYMFFVTGAPPAAAFAIVTSPWPSWRRVSQIHRTWLSVAAGFATFAAQLTGAVSILMLLPFPGVFGPLVAAFRVLLPGIATGLIALAILSLSRRAREEVAEP